MTQPLSEFCQNNGIVLYALPPNTTHILQPADVSVFKPLKLEWKKTIRKWQKLPENVNSCVTKVNFCKVFQSTLDGYDMKNHIINGFRKCGLFPLDPENVDFTKCVQNIIEQQNELNVETNDPLTSEEIRAAEKVILRLRNKLIPKGVNVDLIFDEIKILENEASRQIVIEVGDMIPLDDVTIIPYDNIYVQNDNINLSEPIASTSSFSSPHSQEQNDLNPEVSYEQSTESTLLNSEIPSCDDTVLPIGYHTNNDDYDTEYRRLDNNFQCN
ncbi:hypothetical protein JTB14_017325 [Gonioctena quinquepunctata]|nr:hypothetical protein JTB14_017325 [Gonioctena quinquepunctata]